MPPKMPVVLFGCGGISLDAVGLSKNEKPAFLRAYRLRWTCWNGGEDGDRTHDLRIANATLSRLSYFPSRTNRRLFCIRSQVLDVE